MKIVCLLGSPRRHGNSAHLADYFLEQLQERGAEVSRYQLNDLSMRGCQACDACKIDFERCVIEDDLADVLDAVSTADALVFASPVYYGDVTAQLKMFIDRSYSYLKPGYISQQHPSRFPERKPLVFILTQGHRDPEEFKDILPRYSKIFYWTGFAKVVPLRVIDVYHPGDVEKKRPEVYRQLDEMAADMMAGCNE